MESKALQIDGGGVQASGDGRKERSPFELLRQLGPARILALGAVAAILLAFFGYIAFRASESDYGILFAGLELSDSERLAQRLEAMGVPYRLSAGGEAIMVPDDRILRLRMSLAEEGLPLGSPQGYELLDAAGPFGTSDFMANVNLRRAVEGELARTIGTLRPVRSARVHLVQPKRELFEREAAAPSASIVLSLRGGPGLAPQQVMGIRQLVAAAVPGLSPEKVTIVDDRGNLLAQAADPAAMVLGQTDDYRVGIENRLRARLVQLLERSVGAGHADAEVNADIDFDELTTTSETYDPNGQVVRSTQTSDEDSDSAEQEPQDTVTVANNLPTEQAQDPATAKTSERAKRTEETTNFEISRTVRNQTRRGGVVRRLSVAIQVDGTYREQPDGSTVYEPRSAEELQQLTALVRGAAGIDDARGDTVEVINRRFLPVAAAVEDTAPFLSLERADYWRLADLAVLGLVTILVLLFGVRPLLRRAFPQAETERPEATSVVRGPGGKPLLVHGATGATIGVDGAGNPVVVREPLATGPEAPETGATLDLRNVQGRVRASLVNDVSGVVDRDAELAVRVLRGWLHQS